MKTMLAILAAALFSAGCATLQQPSNGNPDEVLSDAAGITLTVHGMSCPLCANNLDGQLMRVPGITSAEIDLDTGAITVLFAENAEVTRGQVHRAVSDAGFTLRDIAALEDAQEEK